LTPSTLSSQLDKEPECPRIGTEAPLFPTGLMAILLSCSLQGVNYP
jgi:hypothetical protein